MIFEICFKLIRDGAGGAQEVRVGGTGWGWWLVGLRAGYMEVP